MKLTTWHAFVFLSLLGSVVAQTSRTSHQRSRTSSISSSSSSSSTSYRVRTNSTSQRTLLQKLSGGEPCQRPTCPPTQETIEIQNPRSPCPTVRCVPSTKCEIDGSFIQTFDGVRLQYHMCSHVLAREKDEWSINLNKICPEKKMCKNEVSISQGGHKITLNAEDSSVEYDGFKYTPEQAALIGGRTSDFSLSISGNDIFFESKLYGFWVSVKETGDIDIGVSSGLSTFVDGICGKYNNIPSDDMTDPLGNFIRNTQDFGDSWKIEDTKCHDPKCTMENRLKAFQICSSLSTVQVLSNCANIVSIDLYIAPCIERICTCLKYQPEDTCRCEATLKFVKKCHEKEPSIKLPPWRDQLKCPITCPEGKIYTDCFKRFCEPSCENAHNKNACPISENFCTAGCFCPEGLVRKGNQCVKPAECKDCYCWGWGDPHYTNYEGTKFDFQGACTYVATRDVVLDSKEHTFEVLVHNSKCYFAPTTTCTDGLSVLYDDHVVFVRRVGKKIETYVDGEIVTDFPMTTDWLHLESQANVQVTVVIPEIQVEAKYIYELWRFELRLASHVFENNFEGLCGTCNKDKTDDFKTLNGKLTTNMNEFGLSWLKKNLPQGIIVEENCKEPPSKIIEVNDCVPGFPLPSGKDPCTWITDVSKFGKCHALVDTESFIKSCHYDMCHSVHRSAVGCMTVASYVRECQLKGVCLEWRSENSCPFSCPAGEVYKSCGSSCEVTCKNYKNPKCDLGKSEGCFCPDGQVRRHGKCVPVSNCKACDAESHFIGDKWLTDQCTSCTCVDVAGAPTVKCTKITCPMVKIECNKGFKAVLKATSKTCCPEYECIEQACTVDNQFIRTFDGNRFECTILNHVLIQNIKSEKWRVLLKMDCPANEGGKCKKVLSIHQGKYELKIFSDGQFEYDGDIYTIKQARIISEQGQEFRIRRLCDSTIYFESLLHKFWLTYSKNGIVKIVVSQETCLNAVGLCGKCNANQQDDTLTREGNVTATITEVCKSWEEPGTITTITPTCNTQVLDRSLKLCEIITQKEPMNKCAKILDLKWFLDTCKHRMCECIQSGTEENCLCDASLSLFKLCYIEAPEVKLDTWREQLSCPGSCPPGSVFKDCFSQSCEPTCENSKDCIQLPNTCVSGCVCSPGFVRKGEKCVKPSDCRDCTCTGYGDPHYLTFDQQKYDFQGKCTYVAARDALSVEWKKHKFQVLVTNEECVVAPGTSCTHAVTLLYENHVVNVARIEGKNQVTTKLDGELITQFPQRNSWLSIEVLEGNVVTLFVPSLQLQVRYVYKTWLFDISLSSSMFPNNVEGLCGNCNKDPKDDLRTLQGKITTNINEFAKSWLVKEVPSDVEQTKECKAGSPPKPPPEKICNVPTPENDHCSFIMDKNIFQLCHRVISPAPYLESCHYDMCHGVDAKSIMCLTVEAYARECSRRGICLNWRSNQHCPMKCPAGLVYKACGSNCVPTCDNYREYKADPSICQVDPVEGCFCPDGQVLKDGKCISECECDPNNLELEIQIGCNVKLMEPRQTIGLISEVRKKNGKCENKSPIPRFGICAGTCESASKFHNLLQAFVPEGDCCQIATWAKASLLLTCPNGFAYTKEVKIPNSCACFPCPLASPNKRKAIPTKK